MALISNKSKLEQTLLVELVFEDNVTKKCRVTVGDIVKIIYNKNGLATTVQGRVSTISTGSSKTVSQIPRFYSSSGMATYDTTYGKTVGDYIVVDGAGPFQSQLHIIYVQTILDFTMVSSYEENTGTTSPSTDSENGIYRVNMVRVKDGKFQISTDEGATWQTVGRVDDGHNCPPPPPLHHHPHSEYYPPEYAPRPRRPMRPDPDDIDCERAGEATDQDIRDLVSDLYSVYSPSPDPYPPPFPLPDREPHRGYYY